MLLAALLLAATARAATPDELWSAFQQDYERSYDSEAESEYRRGVFMQVRSPSRPHRMSRTARGSREKIIWRREWMVVLL